MDLPYNALGSSPKEWGPGVWQWLHRLPEYGESVFRIASCLDHLCLPCPHCQEHYNQYKDQHPVLEVKTREGMFKWINALHNDVNRKLGRMEISDRDCRDLYCTKEEPRNISEGRTQLRRVFK